LKLWLSISNLRNVPHSLLIATRVKDFASEQFSIDDNETQEEILRRSKSDTYYLESVKVFEQSFAIRKLDAVIEKIQAFRSVSLTPVNNPGFVGARVQPVEGIVPVQP
jgi:hypothetical protein